uniref:Uncharacterized protein n=1 Tax=Panagrellus redivivus TaxID=6233 RepID=A0A7E4ZVK6_PANRE
MVPVFEIQLLRMIDGVACAENVRTLFKIMNKSLALYGVFLFLKLRFEPDMSVESFVSLGMTSQCPIRLASLVTKTLSMDE